MMRVVECEVKKGGGPVIIKAAGSAGYSVNRICESFQHLGDKRVSLASANLL